MNKRGISHVEVILAFVLFITAVGFGLYFFNTADSSRLVDSILNYAQREIEQNTSIDVQRFSVVINRSSFSGTILAINFSGVSGNTFVETYDGKNLSSMREGDIVYVESPTLANEDFLYVTFGDEFQNGVVSQVSLNETDYSIGSSEVKNVLSEKKLLSLNRTYYEDYRGLKNQQNFNLPSRSDFGFSVVFDSGEKILAEQEIPSGFEVFSRNKRVEILRTDGKIVFADLIVRAW